MGDLIYTTAFGQPIFKKMAVVSAMSARARGFTGRFIILTDEAFDCNYAEVMVLKPMEKGQERIWKTRLDEVVNMRHFARILFTDSDIDFIRHPRFLLELADDTFAVSLEHTKIIDQKFNMFSMPGYNGDDLAVNSGTFVMRGDLAAGFFKTWNEYWAENKKHYPQSHKTAQSDRGELYDQPHLQACITRGQIPFKYIPMEMVVFPGLKWEYDHGVKPETVLLHFNGFHPSERNKARVLEYMEDLCEADTWTAARYCAGISERSKKIREKNDRWETVFAPDCRDLLEADIAF